LILSAALLGALGVCRLAQANTISPYVYYWPGIVSVMPVYAFPASLLAAFLERPFLTAAGVARRPLVLSLRANFFSTIVGVLFVPLADVLLYVIGPLWCVVAFGISISCVVEISYLRGFAQGDCRRWILVAGNAASSGTLMVLSVVTASIGDAHRHWARSLESHHDWLMWCSLGASLAVFLGGLFWPVPRNLRFEPPQPEAPVGASPTTEPTSIRQEMDASQ
jgi:hypothetical protein